MAYDPTLTPDLVEHFSHRCAEDERIVFASCDIDIATSSYFEEYIQQVAIRGQALTVDLTRCRYIDSSGLNALVRLHDRLSGMLRVVIPPSGSLARVFHITQLERVLQVSYIAAA